MKRKLSLVLAFVMILSLVPMSAFAASDNSVDRVAKVKDDHLFDVNDAPVLKIENDKGDWAKEETITLVLENADWLSGVASDLKSQISFAKTGKTVVDSVYRKSDSRVELTFKSTDGNPIVIDEVVQIPMLVEMDGDAGKVRIESKSGAITEGTYVFAHGDSGNTKVYIDDTVTFSNIKGIETITIEETAAGTLLGIKSKKYIKLKLDKDFDFEKTGKVVSNLFGTREYTIADLVDKEMAEIDKEELKVYIKPNGVSGDAIELKAQNDSSVKYAEKIEFIGLEVNPGKDAKEGKVNINVSSDISDIKTTKLEIGEFADYKVKIEADGDPKEIYSGRYETNVKDDFNFTGMKAEDLTLTSDEEHELQTLIIDEKAEGSWTPDKSVVVTFPTWVKIIGVDIDGKSGSVTAAKASGDVDENEYEFNVKGSGEAKNKVELTFYVSVEGGKEGDIEAVVSGRALDDEVKVVLGKAVNPVKVEAEVAPIKAGVRDQEIGDITITEVKAGAIQEDKNIVIELDDDMDWDDEPKVEVVDGDLEIDEDNVKVDDNILTIPVDGESTEVSTIKITKSRVKVDRAIAEGSIKVEVKGSAIMQNAYDSDVHKDVKKSDLLDEYGFFNNDYFAKVEVANVVTPADKATRQTAKFVIDNAEYQVGDEVKTADVAPYIKDGRTMLSVRYVAEALGLAENQIVWDGVNRTVTIFGDQIVQITIDSPVLKVGPVTINMDTVAEIKDGRTMLPVSFIATALGAQTEWDAANRTVTVK